MSTKKCEIEFMREGYGYAECHTHRMLFVSNVQLDDHLHIFGGGWPAPSIQEPSPR